MIAPGPSSKFMYNLDISGGINIASKTILQYEIY